MTSENTYRTATITTAAPGTPCGWTHRDGETGATLTCESDRPAMHVLLTTLPVAKAGTALCGYHSPFDVTDADRQAIAYAAWVAEVAKDASVEIIGGHPYGRKSGLPIFRNVADNSPGILARHRARMAAEAEAAEAEADRSGVEVLAELLTLDTVPVPSDRDRVVKFHRLSAPMIGVLTEVARSRGLVGSWAMRNVVVAGVDRATMRTVAALQSRGMLEAQTNDGNQSGTGGLTDYVLTETGEQICEILGTPVVHLPTGVAEIDALVASATVDTCETGCEVLVARGAALLPAGGDVCLGCGSIFTRPSGQEHPALYVISEAVSARNASKGN